MLTRRSRRGWVTEEEAFKAWAELEKGRGEASGVAGKLREWIRVRVRGGRRCWMSPGRKFEAWEWRASNAGWACANTLRTMGSHCRLLRRAVASSHSYLIRYAVAVV